MKNKKSQLKIQEMSFMLVALVLFFAIIVIFAFAIIYSNIQKTVSTAKEERTFSSINVLANSPEFNCGKTNCIDGDKLINILGEKQYFNFWEFSSLKIIRYSAFNSSEDKMIKCSLDNYPECEIFEVYDKKIPERKISSFAVLCFKEQENGEVYDKCEIAKIIAGTEKQEK